MDRCGWWHRRVQTIAEYADEVAGTDAGGWRAAVSRAAQLIEHRHPTVDLSHRLPLTQILLQTTALITYGLAARDDVEPGALSPLAVSAWAATRMLPLPPHPDSALSNDLWMHADRRWRQQRDQAVERIRHDMAQLLRDAGHDVPDADVRSLSRYSADPVVATWIDLADTDPPETAARYGVFEQYPVPRIALGVTALNDLHDD